MDFTYSFQIILIIALVVVAAVFAYYYFFRKEEEKQKERDVYVQALKYLAENDSRRAIEKLKETVRLDTTNVDAYIKLGDLLREQGLVNNAIRIHKDLTLRGTLTQDEQKKIWFSLGKDYWKAGKLESAENYFTKLKSDTEYLPRVIPFLIMIYDKTGKYGQAYDLLKDSGLHKEEKYKHRMALYRTLQGMEKMESGEGKEARVLFKEALKLDPEFVAPYLYMGDSYIKEERQEDAVRVWTDYCQKYPNRSYVLFSRLEKALYEQGYFNKIEELYENILKRDADNVHALIALSQILRKKGEYEAALNLLKENNRPEMDEDLILAEEVKILAEEGKLNVAAKKAIELIDRRITLGDQYICASCGYQSHEPFWKCPKCGALKLDL